MIDTRQLFSVRSDAYAAARPRYPRALFECLVTQCPDTQSAWDCGTGSGQAGVALAEWFADVQATDVSAEQIGNAHPHARVRYSVQAAEQVNFSDRQFSLVTVAQALHWFDLARFWPEVHRVLKPGGLFAAWTYTFPQVAADIDPVVRIALLEVIAPYWAPQNRLAWDGYRSVPFPFDPVPLPAMAMNLRWNCEQFLAYLGTWSAVRLCTQANGAAYFERFGRELVAAWGDPMKSRQVSMEFFCRAGRHEP